MVKLLISLAFLVRCGAVMGAREPLPKPELQPPPLGCQSVFFSGWASLDEMTVNDILTYNQAVIQCQVKFLKSPCITRFEKKGFQDYRVECGGMRANAG